MRIQNENIPKSILHNTSLPVLYANRDSVMLTSIGSALVLFITLIAVLVKDTESNFQVGYNNTSDILIKYTALLSAMALFKVYMDRRLHLASLPRFTVYLHYLDMYYYSNLIPATEVSTYASAMDLVSKGTYMVPYPFKLVNDASKYYKILSFASPFSVSIFWHCNNWTTGFYVMLQIIIWVHLAILYDTTIMNATDPIVNAPTLNTSNTQISHHFYKCGLTDYRGRSYAHYPINKRMFRDFKNVTGINCLRENLLKVLDGFYHVDKQGLDTYEMIDDTAIVGGSVVRVGVHASESYIRNMTTRCSKQIDFSLSSFFKDYIYGIRRVDRMKVYSSRDQLAYNLSCWSETRSLRSMVQFILGRTGADNLLLLLNE